MTTRPSGYRNYSSDGTYWTVRKHQATDWVVRIDPNSGGYVWDDVWGGYSSAGHAAGAAALLAYKQGVADATARLRGVLHDALEGVGLGSLPDPAKPPVPASKAPKKPQADDEGVADDDGN